MSEEMDSMLADTFWDLEVEPENGPFDAQLPLEQQAGFLKKRTHGLVHAFVKESTLPAQTLSPFADDDSPFARLAVITEFGREKPKALLDQEAALIGGVFKGRLPKPPIVRYDFILNVPAMANYVHRLFSVEHLETGLPAVMASPTLRFYKECRTLPQFEEGLRKILQDPRTHTVVRALALQAQKALTPQSLETAEDTEELIASSPADSQSLPEPPGLEDPDKL